MFSNNVRTLYVYKLVEFYFLLSLLVYGLSPSPAPSPAVSLLFTNNGDIEDQYMNLCKLLLDFHFFVCSNCLGLEIRVLQTYCTFWIQYFCPDNCC